MFTIERSVVSIVLAMFACAAQPDHEEERVDDVIRGTRDRDRHPAVVALRHDDGTLCTGSLLAPRLVLTARHCVSETTATITCAPGRRHVLREHDPRRIAVVTDEDALTGRERARAVRVIVPDTQSLCGADVALLVLDREVADIEPLQLEERAQTVVGDVVTVVGYGRRGDSPRAGFGRRYQRANVRIFEANAREFTTGEGTCAGDSGGPALDARNGRVLGVLSRGGDRCVGDTRAVYTSAFVARQLLHALR